jgi:transcriptional regulator with XRE-family HTH domain
MVAYGISAMPRAPSRNHVVRIAREIIGLSQRQLAERTGIAAVTLKRFENGEIRISRSLAIRICAEVLIHPDQLLENRDPLRPDYIGGGPLTREKWQRDQDSLAQVPKAEIAKERNEQRKNLDRLIDQSVKRGKFAFIHYALLQAFADVGVNLGLLAGSPRKRARRAV